MPVQGKEPVPLTASHDPNSKGDGTRSEKAFNTASSREIDRFHERTAGIVHRLEVLYPEGIRRVHYCHAVGTIRMIDDLLTLVDGEAS